MNRQELQTRIHGIIEKMQIWPAIAMGDVKGQCKRFSTAVYNALTNPLHAIDGLTLAVVEADVYHGDHAWLLAHHPDVGFLIIDPTAGQYIANRRTHECFRDVFIGTSDELERLADGKHSDYVTERDQIYRYWSPSARFYQAPGESSNPPGVHAYYKESDIEPVWSRYEFEIHRQKLDGAEHVGRWAARMEEAGINWRRQMQDDLGRSWPDPRDHEEMDFYRRTIDARNWHIELGRDQAGSAYNNHLVEYRPNGFERK